MAKTYYHWDADDNVCQELDEQGNVTCQYTHMPGKHGELLSENRGGTVRHYHHDAQGNTTELTDDSGAVTDTFTYSAFGEQLSRTGTTPTPYRWNGAWGYQYDEGLESYYVRARVYEPAIARWISVDPVPIGMFGLPNSHYAYARNSPSSFLDPSGRDPIAFWFAAFIPASLGEWNNYPYVGGMFGLQYRGDMRNCGDSGTSRLITVGSIDSSSIGFIDDVDTTTLTSGTHQRHWSGGSWHYSTVNAVFTEEGQNKTGSTHDFRTNPPTCTTTVQVRVEGGYPASLIKSAIPTLQYIPDEILNVVIPKIDYTARFTFSVSGPNQVTVSVSGTHNSFPSYDAIIDGIKPIYCSHSAYSGPGFVSLGDYVLFSSGEHTIEATTPKCCSS